MRPGRTIEERQEWPGLRRARMQAKRKDGNRGLSLVEATRDLCSASTLWGWENGLNRPPRFAVRELAKRYGVKMRSLRRAKS